MKEKLLLLCGGLLVVTSALSALTGHLSWYIVADGVVGGLVILDALRRN